MLADILKDIFHFLPHLTISLKPLVLSLRSCFNNVSITVVNGVSDLRDCKCPPGGAWWMMKGSKRMTYIMSDLRDCVFAGVALPSLPDKKGLEKNPTDPTLYDTAHGLESTRML